MSSVLAILNDAPINFYGKVVDQNNNPIADVTVTGTAAISKQWMDETFDAHTTATDAAVLFRFEGLHGMGLGINLSKQGYEYTPTNNSFTYSKAYPEKERFKPNANAPVIFKMWKLQGPQKLVEIALGAYVSCDGTPVSYDLLIPRRVDSGDDITVTITRSPPDVSGLLKFDWKAVIQANNGGFIPMNDQYPNEAPAEGYQSRIVIDMPQSAAPWFSDFRHSYYWQGRGGKYYGRVDMQIFAGFTQPEVPFNLTGVANPNGSRNLEASHRQR